MIEHGFQFKHELNRVVILGGSGFLGKALTQKLTKEKINVLPLSSQDINLLDPKSTCQLLTLLKEGDFLILASAITPDKGKDGHAYMKNMNMAYHLYDLLDKLPIAHLTYISSDAVYDENISFVRETSACTQSNLYGLMHLSREALLTEGSKKRKLPFLILRPSALYGNGDTHNSYGPNRFIRSAKTENKITLFGNGEEKRDHLFIHDFCEIATLCLSYASSGVLNIATGNAVSFYNVAQEVSAVLGQPVEIITTPRVSPVTHKHFDLTALTKVFPEFTFTKINNGLQSFL